MLELLAQRKGLLFPNDEGKIDGHLLRKLKNAAKKSGVPKIKLRRFRDTFITNKLRNGVDVRSVQRWAGHEGVSRGDIPAVEESYGRMEIT